jgi:hypothetical protein
VIATSTDFSTIFRGMGQRGERFGRNDFTMASGGVSRWGFLFFLLTSLHANAHGSGGNLFSTPLAARTSLCNASNKLVRSDPAEFNSNQNNGDSVSGRASKLLSQTMQVSSNLLKIIQSSGWHKPLLSSGIYYGLPMKTLNEQYSESCSIGSTNPKSKLSIRDTMAETLDELKYMRHEMEALRKELLQIKRAMLGEEALGDEDDEAMVALRRTRQRKYDTIGQEVEIWAKKLLADSPADASSGDVQWSVVECNKMFKSTVNKNDRTRAYLTWMKDSRAKYADKNDESVYPCLKVFSTIDASFDDVCTYLADESRAPEYNQLVLKHKDVDEISSHSKICWAETPQILFIKPRELFTFCHHRWLRDGTQVIVNQAVDEREIARLVNNSGKKQIGSRPKAFAIRGASFISPDPDHAEKTKIAMILHASPGSDVPSWAVKAAVKTMLPIEPFKLFHMLNEGIMNARPMLEQARRKVKDTEQVSSETQPSVSKKPAGMAQMGFACFWPNGGGLQESGLSLTDQPQTEGGSEGRQRRPDVGLQNEETKEAVSEALLVEV